MDTQPILNHHSATPADEGNVPDSSASRSATASVSAGIADANAHLPQAAEPGPRFPAEDGGRSLAEMAHNDLDAALQLLAERAHYITGASGAAIALRRGEHNDMLCRASAGSNAPELGSLLSMEYGLSGESVRTRQTLRCDDAERDPRVNREGCRQLGIASVVVMPIVSDQQVLGVFELFSGKPRAFEARDISALQRLSEMVETAVKHAVAALTMPAVEEPVPAEPQPPVDGIEAEASRVESPVSVEGADLPPTPTVRDAALNNLAPPEPVETELEPAKPAPKQPLFWSAAMQAPTVPVSANEIGESLAVPPGLRKLQKCQACGFPVSQGRTFCVECEEKQWRGQRLPQPASGTAQQAHAHPQVGSQVIRATGDAPEISLLQNLSSARTSTQTSTQTSVQTSALPKEAAAGEPAMAASVVADLPESIPKNVSATDSPTLFLSSATPSESWFAANKYILGALLVVAIVIGAIVWLR
jgi:hypothetical protein